MYRKSAEPLEKSLFEKVYQKEFNDLEKNIAWYLDESQCVHGVEDDRFYFSVLETKGDRLKGNDDTEYKRKLFDLLTRYADVTASTGQLVLEDQDEPMRFLMVLEKDWEQILLDEGIRLGQ